MGKLSCKRVADMNEACRIKPFMISTTLGSGLKWHPWFTGVIPLALGTIHTSKDCGNGPLRSNYPRSYVSSLTWITDVPKCSTGTLCCREENRPWAQVHFCFTGCSLTLALFLFSALKEFPSKDLLSGSESAINLGFSHFFLFSLLCFSLTLFFF